MDLKIELTGFLDRPNVGCAHPESEHPNISTGLTLMQGDTTQGCDSEHMSAKGRAGCLGGRPNSADAPICSATASPPALPNRGFRQQSGPWLFAPFHGSPLLPTNWEMMLM